MEGDSHRIQFSKILECRFSFITKLERICKNASLHWKFSTCQIREDRNIEIDTDDLSTLSQFGTFQNQDWQNICTALGWTVYGAIALSWCDGAQLRDVWSGWLASGFPLKPLPEYERPARFLNPALLPQTASLREIVAWANGQGYTEVAMYDLAISAVIAGLKAPLILDMPAGQMAQASPQIAAFLRSRLLQKPGYGAEELALLDAWGARIKGSAYDISEMV